MNKITEIFKNISDEELQIAIEEIKTTDETGIVGSIAKMYMKQCNAIMQTNANNLLLVQMNLLKEAAYRWINQKS